MTNIPAQFDEGLNASRELIRLKIRKSAYEEEDFNPEALLYSLLEAEVPLTHVFHVFDRILERLAALNDLAEITGRQLHGLVTKALSSYSHPDASVWVLNYQEAFPSENERDEDDFEWPQGSTDDRSVSARKAKVIRNLIKSHLSGQLCVEPNQVTDLIDGDDLREATSRILRVIRFAGFTELPFSALASVVEALAAHSQKNFVHRNFPNAEALNQEIGLAERAFEAARKMSDSDQGTARTEFRLALELLGRIFLAGCQLPSRPARQMSFQYLATLLRSLHHGAVQHPTQQAVKPLVKERVYQSFAKIVRNPQYHIDTLREAADVLTAMDSAVTANDFAAGAKAFRFMLYTARDLHGFASGRSAVLRALEMPAEERSQKVCEAATEFVSNELHLKWEPVECGCGAVVRVRDLPWLKVHAECLRHGRDVLLLFRFGARGPLSKKDVQEFLYLVLADTASFGIVFSDQDPDPTLFAEMRHLSQIQNRRIVAWLDVNAMAKALLRRDTFLATIDDALKRAMPWLNAPVQQSRPEDREMIPSEITGYARECLAVFNRLEAERDWSGIKAEITPFLEEITSDYKQFLYERVLHSVRKEDRQAAERQLQPSALAANLGSAREFERKLPPGLPAHVSFAVQAFVGFVERVRSQRNQLVHEHASASDIAHALSHMKSALLELASSVPYAALYVCVNDSGGTGLSPLFGAAEHALVRRVKPGEVIAVWNLGSGRELVLPKRLKPHRDDLEPAQIVIDLQTGELAGTAAGSQGRLPPILSRALKSLVLITKDVSRPPAAPPENDLALVSSFLSRIAGNAQANATPLDVVSTLGSYDYELAVLAVREALSAVIARLDVSVHIELNENGIVLTDASGGKIGCLIFDQTRLQADGQQWAWQPAAGQSDQFVFLFADPNTCEEHIRRFKRETISATAGAMHVVSRILEPKHTYYLLQRTGVETAFIAVQSGDEQLRHVQMQRTGADSVSVDRFDVFICYNTKNRDAVFEIVEQLREANIKPWVDVEQVRPGTSFVRELQQQIESIGTAAVFIGPDGAGPWQNEEIEAILKKFGERNRLVIPVILPSGEEPVEMPLFLDTRRRVDFRALSPPPLEELIWGITGRRHFASSLHRPSEGR